MNTEYEDSLTLKVKVNKENTPQGKMDTDGILILNEWDTSKFSFNIGWRDISRPIPHFAHDCKGDRFLRKTDWSLVYWNMVCREGRFSSTGKKNWTVRPEIYNRSVTNTTSGVNNAKRQGYIGQVNDVRDQEFTVIGRVKGIRDENEIWSLKASGDGHEKNKHEKTLCCAVGYPYKKRKAELYGAELIHPNTAHRMVTFMVSEYPLMAEGWIGIKGVIYNINNNNAIHGECWIDKDPIDRDHNGRPTGRFKNNWDLVWVYEEQRNDTVTWGGPSNQMRVDMCKELDMAALNVRAIIPPTTSPVEGIPINTEEINDYVVDENDITKEETVNESNDEIAKAEGKLTCVNPRPYCMASSSTAGFILADLTI